MSDKLAGELSRSARVRVVKFVAVALAAALVIAVVGAPGPGIDPEVTGSIDVEAGSDLRVILAGSDTGCQIHRSRAADQNRWLIVPDVGCASTAELFASARYWTVRPDGTVEISDSNGDPFLQFMAGEGADYESYGAGAPLVQLIAD